MIDRAPTHPPPPHRKTLVERATSPARSVATSTHRRRLHPSCNRQGLRVPRSRGRTLGFLHRGTSTRHTVVMPVSSRNSSRKRIGEIILSRRMVNIGLVGWLSLFTGASSLVMCRFPGCAHLVYFRSPGFWVRTCPGDAVSCPLVHFCPYDSIFGESMALMFTIKCHFSNLEEEHLHQPLRSTSPMSLDLR